MKPVEKTPARSSAAVHAVIHAARLRSPHRCLRSVPLQWSAATLLALAACAAQAQASAGSAELAPTLQFRVGERVERDSNLFRLSDSADAAATIGSSSRADTYAVTTLGVKLDKRYSLQRFELDIYADDYRYKRLSSLDFTALNYAGAWRWSLTPRLHGNLTADRRETVDNTLAVQAPGEVNRRTETHNLLDAEYEVGAAWRALAGVFEDNQKNSSPFNFEPDTKVSGGEIGARYVLASGNSVAYRFKSGSGDYRGGLATLQAPSGFSDREHEFSLEWQATGATSVQGQVSHLKRVHDNFAARDFSGVKARLNANWTLTGKTRIEAGLVRELNSYQTSDASYYEGDRLYISPVWKPTEKTAVRLRAEQGVRRYKGELAGVAPTGRRDTTTLTALSLEWEPLRSLLLSASLLRDKRTSNTPGFDYKANVVGLSALLRF